MSSRRKAVDTSLFRPKEEIEQEEQQRSTSRDMSSDTRAVKRASFDVYADQIERLGILKYKSKQRMSDMVRDALDEYLARHEQ